MIWRLWLRKRGAWALRKFAADLQIAKWHGNEQRKPQKKRY